MSRRPKPSALRILEGNPGKRPIPNNEPKPKAARPKLPGGLKPEDKAIFRSLCDLLEDMGILTIADGMALELLTGAYSEWLLLNEMVTTEGATYRTKNAAGDEMIKAHPAVAMRSDAWKRVKSMMAEYGLTASARTKVQTIEKEANDPLEAYLNRRSKPEGKQP